MSNFSQAHTVVPFDAKKSAPLSGQRLAKVRYKNTEKQAAKFPSVCASVPFIDTEAIHSDIDRLLPYIKGMLENAQDGVLRSLYETSEGNLSHVTDSDISIDACIKFLEAENQGSRLTKEFLEAWFDSSVAETVQALVVEKLKYDSDTLTPEQELKIAQVTKGYKDVVSSLAGGKTILQPGVIKNLKGVLELVDTDETSTKLMARLVQMENKPTMEELLGLVD